MKLDADDTWLLPFLAQIRQRPGMYLGHESARLLSHYLAGYCQARADLGLPVFGRDEPDHLARFRDWLARRHDHGRTTMGWCDMIEQLDPSDRNLGTFFREFEMYLGHQGIELGAVAGRLPAPWSGV